MPSTCSTPPTDLIQNLLHKTADAIYRKVADFTLTAWTTAEPVSFSQRQSGKRLEVQKGQSWGEHVFDCAWFRFLATVPALHRQQRLVARIDIGGELLIVDAHGNPARGLTNIKSTFDPNLGCPGKTVYEIPAQAISHGQIELWADAGFNDLFGFVADSGRVTLAELAVVNEETRALYYDLETLGDYLCCLPQGEAAERLHTQLAELYQMLNPHCGDSVREARERLAPWFENTAKKPSLVVHAIGHAHIDLAWLWPIRETIRKAARTFATALYNIERYPQYIFGASQPQLFAWVKQHYPSLYTRIRQAVQAGRIELQGSFWVEPDCNIPNGESYVRQVLHGRRFFLEEFGHCPDYCWEPDVFGYNGQLPQLLRKSGHRYFMTQKLSWNIVNRFPHHSFHWEGIDGSRILTHMLPEETYNSPAAAHSLHKINSQYAQRDVSDHALMAFGIGDGGGGPDAEHMERLTRAHLLQGMPEVKIEAAGKFFTALEPQAGAFPVWRGELYLERHQGTLTTQALVKRNNRMAETALRELEWTAAMAAELTGLPPAAQELDALWKEVLLYQFHDILPGSSIKRVYDECNARYAELLGRIHQLCATSRQALADTLAPEKGATVIFNSLAWPRSEWLHHSGNWQHITVPANGWASLPANVATPAQAGSTGFNVRASATSLENEHLLASFDAGGHLLSLRLKATGQEVLAQGGGNVFAIIADKGDAWDYEFDAPTKDVLGYLRQPVCHPHLHSSRARTDGPLAELTQVWHYKTSQIHQRIRLLSGSRQIEFSTEVHWREEATMLRVRFATAIHSESARFEIPFGHIERSTLEQTSIQSTQFESAAQQWVDLSQADLGLALYNDCKYGFRIKGSTIDMALLRSVPHPGAPLINKEDRSAAAPSNFTDLGSHRFSYALRPHTGKIAAAVLTSEARMLNTPLSIATSQTPAQDTQDTITTSQAPALDTPCSAPVSQPDAPSAQKAPPPPAIEHPATGSWLQMDSPEIETAALKAAEDGNGYVLRMVNLEGRSICAHFKSTLPATEWVECDLLESPLAPPAEIAEDGTHTLHFAPFEIKTLRSK